MPIGIGIELDMPSKMVAASGSESTAGTRSDAFTTPDGNSARFLTPSLTPSLQENAQVATDGTSVDSVTTPQLPKDVNDAAIGSILFCL